MKASHLLYNGKIHTLDPKVPLVSSMAIDGNTIVAAGNDELRFQFDDAVEKIDLQQKVVIPGMVDAHAHLQLYTQSMHNVNLIDTRSVQEATARIQVFVENNRDTGWIQGWGWCQDDWPDRAFPTAEMIDQVHSLASLLGIDRTRIRLASVAAGAGSGAATTGWSASSASWAS